MRLPKVDRKGAGSGLGLPRGVLVAAGGLADAYLLAQAAVDVASAGSVTIGLVARSLALPVGLLAVLALVLITPALRDLIPALPSWRSLLWVLVSALLGGPIVFGLALLFSSLSLTHVFVGILAAAGTGVALFLAFTRQDAWGMAIFLVTLPFVFFLESAAGSGVIWRGGFVGPFVVSIPLTLFWGLTLVTIVGRLLRNEWSGWPPVSGPVLAFSFLLFLSALASQDPLRSFRDVSLDVLGGVLFLFLAWFSVRSRGDVLLLVIALVVFGVLRVTMAYYLFTQRAELGSLVNEFRSTAQSVQHPGVIGWVGQFTLALTLGLLLMQRNRASFAIFGLISTWILAALFLTGLRSTIVTLALTLPPMCIFLFSFFPRRFTIGLLFMIVGFSAYLLLFTPDVLDRLGRWSSIDMFVREQGIRLDYWQAALRIFLDHPLFGVGPGMAGDYYPLYTDRMFLGGIVWIPMNHPHNLALHYASQAGLLATVSLGVILFLGARGSSVLLSRLSTGAAKDPRPLAVGLSWALLAAVVSGLVGGTSFANGILLWGTPGVPFPTVTLDLGFLFWFTLGLLFAFQRVVEAASSSPVGLNTRPETPSAR